MATPQVGFLAAFGGGILSALLIQDPKRAPLALLSSNAVGVTWTLCWWAVNYCPGNLVARALAALPCRALAKARDAWHLFAAVGCAWSPFSHPWPAVVTCMCV